ncbi:MAG: TRIC cation channel family protein, partial [Lentisphaeria bacterium]|nr:TRIC cation channel family protein [Lentisphaeria bacterium]
MEETFIYIADLAGTIIFAVTGAIKGISRKLDLLGVVVLSCTVGVGGGIFRDCV